MTKKDKRKLIKKHKYCPNCGGDEDGMNMKNNKVVCICGWAGKVEELVDE